MICHHPSIDKLTAFSAGTLPLGQSVCISAHIDQCPECRQRLKRLNQVGAEMLEQLHPVGVSDSLKDRVFALLDQPDNYFGELPTPQNAGESNVPKALRSLVPNGFEALPWKRLSKSIRAAKLCSDLNGSKLEMLEIKAGGQVASHNHTGEEITLVLEGSFSDSQGVYRAGDIVYRYKEDRNHRPIASQDHDCLCLTCVESPIQFTGFFSRLLNPLIRRSHYAS